MRAWTIHSLARSPNAAVVVVAAALCLAPGRAGAQLVDNYFQPLGTGLGGVPADNSRGRELNRFEAGGVHAGAFTIRPNLEESFGYNSNVEGISRGRGSTVMSTRGVVDARSNWTRNSAYLNVTVDDQRYLDVPRQSFTNYGVTLGGTLDVGRDQLRTRFSHMNLTQIPGGIDAVTVAQPVSFRVDTGQLSYKLTTGGRLSFEPGVTVSNFDYDNYVVGTVRSSQAYRNRVAAQGELTTRYSLGPDRDALVVLRGTNISYGSRGQNGAPKRDSNGGAALAGLDYPTPGANIRFRVLAGVQLRNYVNNAYENLVSPIIEASVIWTPTRLTTVTLSARRDIEDASDESIAGYTYTAGRISVDHELRRNVMLNAFGEVLHAEYQSARLNIATPGFAEAGTVQTIYSAGARATWLLNRNLRAGVSVGVSDRTGGPVNSNYTSYLSLFTLGFRL